MEFFSDPANFMSMASTALLLLLTTNRALDLASEEDSEDTTIDESSHLQLLCLDSSDEMLSFRRVVLHSFRLCHMYSLLDEELKFWVKPRSTTWFSRFLLEQYDDKRWIQMFCMTKPAVLSLAEVLKPRVFKKDTNYRLSIPVLVQVACTLFKLTHGASLLICSEMFAIGQSTVSLVLRDVVQAVNIVLRSQILWPTSHKLLQTEVGFKRLCGLPGVLGAIDGTHISISKPKNAPADYFYFKSRGFTLNCQAIVDSDKRFLDLFLGMPGSTNDSRVLRRSSVYHRAMQSTLWDAGVTFHSFSPYLLRDSGYPLLPWLMVPHRGRSNLLLAETLFNKKLRRGRGVVENAFGILKLSFRELLVKSDLDVCFLPNVITACAILHNMLLGQSHEEVERHFEILRMEGLQPNAMTEEGEVAEASETVRDDIVVLVATKKRRDLVVFLALQRTPTN